MNNPLELFLLTLNGYFSSLKESLKSPCFGISIGDLSFFVSLYEFHILVANF